jgi:hypothetical protein
MLGAEKGGTMMTTETNTMMTTETKLTSARETADRFEARIWADGRDLEQLTDDEAAEYGRLIEAERNLYEQLREERGWPVSTPL